MSCVNVFFFFDKLVKLVGGGSVINGATPSSFFNKFQQLSTFKFLYKVVYAMRSMHAVPYTPREYFPKIRTKLVGGAGLLLTAGSYQSVSLGTPDFHNLLIY